MKKRTLIMLPGWGMEEPAWGLIRHQLERFFSVVTIDWRHAEDISCFNDRIDIESISALEPVIVVGWSLGALAALNIASQHPALVSHLILFGGTSRFTRNIQESYQCGWHTKIVERMKVQLTKDKEQTLKSFYRAMFSDVEQEQGFYDFFIDKIRSGFKGDQVQSLCTGLDYLIQTDLREILKEIKAPVLLIHGDKDEICPPQASDYIATRLKNTARLVTLQNAGHLPFLTQPETCWSEIKGFLQEA